MGILRGKGGRHGILLQQRVNRLARAKKEIEIIRDLLCAQIIAYDKEVP
jgi:hypothetical protein